MKRAVLLAALALLLVAASEPPVPPPQETRHVVRPGETLGGIAARAQVPRVLIAEANGLEPPYAIRAGQKLVIPRTRHHTVARGETGFALAYRYGVPWPEIATASDIDPDAPIRPGQKLLIPTIFAPQAIPSPSSSSPAATITAARFAWPLAGPIRRGFTARAKASYHDGLDITAREGAAVRSIAAGQVIYAGSERQQFGNLVIVDHGGGWHSAYAFLSRITVKEEEHVRQGERIGLVGRTGMAKGNELHFELRRDNRPVDPLAQLPKRD